MKRFNCGLIALITLTVVAAGCCNRRNAGSQDESLNASQAASQAEEAVTYFTAIDKYLVEKIAPGYADAEICIPFNNYVAVDESNADDILVWGDFWVLNYTQAGDTLKCVSGGNHAGKMHVRQLGDNGFEVTSFEQVGDGSTFLPTAKAIFGDKLDAFMAAYSDQDAREEKRKEVIAGYVGEHNLPVKVYQDYGWPAVPIPLD